MTFPRDYPISPPTFRFLDNKFLFHPNIYTDGKLCISILHPPGEDEMSGETASERWSPLQGVESVLRSVLLLLDDPEITSPANVDAGVLYRDHRGEYDARAKKAVEESKKNIPAGVKVPTHDDLMQKPAKPSYDDDDFWNESEEDFDGSESDGDMEEDEEDEDE
jgi:ubiquitin-conjugating enzyme E2 R